MAPTTLLTIALALAVSMQATLGSTVMNCKDLNVDACAYAVESSGKRCVLEKPLLSIVNSEYTCATSNIMADKLSDWIETEECISACGVDRKALGISSDSLLDSSFVGKLCSHECYRNCPNIVDLYFNLAAGVGMYLPKFCEARESNGRRGMLESSEESKLAAPEPNIPKALAHAQISGKTKLVDADDSPVESDFCSLNPWDCKPPSPAPSTDLCPPDSPAPSTARSPVPSPPRSPAPSPDFF